jgi:hypothetical protein
MAPGGTHDREDAMTDEVLELRVHGVNNTAPAALLDLPSENVALIAGDKLGSFWEPQHAPDAAPKKGQRGHVPEGIRRVAYSWGGMVRTVPNAGGVGIGGVLAGVVARIGYVLILPFAIGNSVIWTRELTLPWSSGGRIRSGITAALARTFGLVLTLLFTTTAIALALDIVATQCGADAARCGPLEDLLAPTTGWSSGQRLGALGLIPVAAILVLWIVSAVSRLRYDQLPGMQGASPEPGTASRAGRDAAAAASRPAAVLSQPGFWSNRVTRHLARVHLAAAFLLIACFLCAQTAENWAVTCGEDAAAAGCARGWRDAYLYGFWAAVVLLVVAAVLIMTVRTMTILPPDDDTDPAPRTADDLPPNQGTLPLLIGSIVLLVAVEASLVLLPSPARSAERLVGIDDAVLWLVVAGAAIALSGVFWRLRHRRATAWWGCAPAVFMTVALATATATSAMVVVTTADWLSGWQGASRLIAADPGTVGSTLQIPISLVALATTIVAALLLAVLIVGAAAFLRRRDVSERAGSWGAPTEPAQVDVDARRVGVLPPSRRSLLARMNDKRVAAARLHLVEPAVSVVAALLAVGIAAGLVWVGMTSQAGQLWAGASPGTAGFIKTVLGVSLPLLGAIAAVLVAVLASGATKGGTRPLGIVWDIVCFLPRTGHPFGPPCYAERAVPEIAGYLYAWLSDPEREKNGQRAILAAHSMGGVLAVSAIGLLASTDETRRVLSRLSLLTFGIQLRAFFGRMLPELLGPDVLGTRPSRAPRLWAKDPWAADWDTERGADREAAPTPGSPDVEVEWLTRLDGTLVRTGSGDPGAAATPVDWVSLWRPTDFLGFPAVSTAEAGPGRDGGPPWVNAVDKRVRELDTTGYMVEIGTHGEYYRAPEYDLTLTELKRPRRLPPPS